MRYSTAINHSGLKLKSFKTSTTALFRGTVFDDCLLLLYFRGVDAVHKLMNMKIILQLEQCVFVPNGPPHTDFLGFPEGTPGSS